MTEHVERVHHSPLTNAMVRSASHGILGRGLCGVDGRASVGEPLIGYLVPPGHVFTRDGTCLQEDIDE